MRTFKIPFKTEFKDKVFGGYLSGKQLAWLAAPILLLLVVFMDHSLTMKVVNGKEHMDWQVIGVLLLIDIVLLAITSVFAFVKINDTDLDRYLLKMLIFKLKDKKIKYYE